MSRGSSLLPFSLLFLLSFFLLSRADPVSIPFRDCYDTSKGVDHKFNVDSVYAQVLQNGEFGTFLNLTVFGTSPSEIVGYTNSSGSLATLFTTTSILTLNAFTNSAYFCQYMRPQSPLPALEGNKTDYCPIAAGPFAFAQSIPWGNNRELTTLHTRLRAVDPFGEEVLCLDVATMPLDPTPHSKYGKANIILWSTVGLTVAYFAVVGLARVQSAWNRGISRSGKGIWGKAQSAGFILASAVSGERLANSPALLRFCTPSMKDIIFHTQWCALLGMVAVEWPQFAYPLLTQTAWSTLTYNVTLTNGARENHWNPISTTPFSPPTGFADQIADPRNPLYIDPNVPNVIYHLPSDASHGISSFAYTLGVRPQDLFPTCLILFLGIIAGTIVISGIFWFIDVFVTSTLQKFAGNNTSAYGPTGRGVKSPAFGRTTSKEVNSPLGLLEDDSSNINGLGLAGLAMPVTSSGNGLSVSPSGEPRDRGYHRSSWWCFPRLRSDIGSFHGNVLHGNLVRILILFHLPVTVLSCYQMTLPRSAVSQSSIALAALSFVFISILIPAHLVIRVTFTSTNKLYDDMRTLLSLGPLYNHYRHGYQLFACLLFVTNLAFGITIGAGQRSGTAQAIIILVVEVISALVTSIWLPWGPGASMGLISFLFCVARIVIAVLLVILTPTISIGSGPAGWVAYGIMVVLALVYLALVLLLLVKLIEAVIRIFGQIGFDRSRHVVDSGLVGACGMLGCCGARRRNNGRRKGKNNGRSGKYKGSELGTSPSSQNLGSVLLRDRRPSDLSSYNPPAALLHGDNGSESGSLTGPRFLGGADSRKGSTNSQPPSVLRLEHANQPYREETDMSWWNENEGQGGAFIMGAWQPFAGQTGNGAVNNSYVPVANPQSTPPASAKPSPQAATPSTGFSRVGGGRAHIDSPYSIHPTGNNHSQSGFQNPNSSTHAFPSSAPHSAIPMNASLPPSSQNTPSATPVQTMTPSQAAAANPNAYPPSSFNRHYQPPPAPSYLDDDEPLPLASVRQAHTGPMQMVVQPPPHSDFSQLPPGAMQPAHIRTKSQTAIIEDAGSLLYGPNSNTAGPSASQSGIAARFSLSNHPSLQPIKIPNASGTGGRNTPTGHVPPTSAPPLSKFTLAADDDDNDDDSIAEDQHQKKKWYQLRKKRPHSSEGRTTTTATPSAITGSSSSVPLPLGREGSGEASGDGLSGTPQRSFVVIRKPMGSTGKLNQAVATAAAANASGQLKATSPRSRPPTR